MTDLYYHRDDQDELVVCGRHRKPVTDELLIWTRHVICGGRSVVLNRVEVEQLVDVLRLWLETGWPGVKKSEASAEVQHG